MIFSEGEKKIVGRLGLMKFRVETRLVSMGILEIALLVKVGVIPLSCTTIKCNCIRSPFSEHTAIRCMGNIRTLAGDTVRWAIASFYPRRTSLNRSEIVELLSLMLITLAS
jgi:hypothetical protein